MPGIVAAGPDPLTMALIGVVAVSLVAVIVLLVRVLRTEPEPRRPKPRASTARGIPVPRSTPTARDHDVLERTRPGPPPMLVGATRAVPGVRGSADAERAPGPASTEPVRSAPAFAAPPTARGDEFGRTVVFSSTPDSGAVSPPVPVVRTIPVAPSTAAAPATDAGPLQEPAGQPMPGLVPAPAPTTASQSESDRDRAILERAALELAAHERAARAIEERGRAEQQQAERMRLEQERVAREQDARDRATRERTAREQQAAHDELARAEAVRAASERARSEREHAAREQAALRQTEAQRVLRERAATGGRERPTRARASAVRSPRDRRPQPRATLQKTDAAQVTAWAAEVDGFSRYGFGSRGIVVHNGSSNRMSDVVIAVSWSPSAPPAIIGVLPPGTFYLAQQPGDAMSSGSSWAYPEAVDQLGADVRALPATESHAVLEVGFRDDEGRPWRRAADGTLARGR